MGRWLSRSILCLFAFMMLGMVAWCATADAEEIPFAHVQAVPMPHVHQVSFRHDGKELARYHYDPQAERPFWFPLIGPAGRYVTRMTHPHDPTGHSHHNSVWISHQNVGGVNFWEDPGPAKIVHRKLEKFEDGPDSASVTTANAWLGPDGAPLLHERRRMTVRPLERAEWMLIVELRLTPTAGDVTFGQNPFGLIGVRVAKTMGVRDGGGTIRNSEGAVNEKAVFRKPARWVDYSGRVTPDRVNGITLMDHPQNPSHPTPFHVRNDGWMGASFTLKGAYVLRKGKVLRLLYALYVHDGMPAPAEIDKMYASFAKIQPILK